MPVKWQMTASAGILPDRRNERQSIERHKYSTARTKAEKHSADELPQAPLPSPDVTGNRTTHAKIPSSLFPEQDCTSSACDMEPIGCQSAVVGADGS